MVSRSRSPVLIGREREFEALEDALLRGSRGEGGLALLAGEAGQGKTRLATELAAQARKLGFQVLWGSCSEAELSLPYLPFMQAFGNYLTERGPAGVAAALGPAARELAQLFPQLDQGARQPDGGGEPDGGGDPAQGKLRLFEAIVSLLEVPAREQGLLLVIDDVHWADASTRELLDHLVRRSGGLRMLALATYQSDELTRRHPLMPVLQAWRRSGLAQTVTIGPLSAGEVAQMIGAIFETDDVSPDFRDLIRERSEGNPFVVEEMLKDAVERGDLWWTDGEWERKPIDELRIPETVRDTILLRLQRLGEVHVPVLQAAAVLGRSFAYPTLAVVSGADDPTVRAALDAAVSRQLIEEDLGPGRPATYRWRHVLTQEAISNDIVLPRRQELHALAAETLAADPGAPAVDVALHLLGAGRFAEAVPACLRAASEAATAAAHTAAASLYQKALPHITESLQRAVVTCKVGRNYWLDGESARAEQWLSRGVRELHDLGEQVEAARFRLDLGRCRWERQRPDLALRDFEAARTVLEQFGPSADLAIAYVRIAGLHIFELDGEKCLEASQRAVEIAHAAGADQERVRAEAYVALGLLNTLRVGEAFDLMNRVFDEAVSKGFAFIAQTVGYNQGWTRLHLMMAGLERVVQRLASLPQTAAGTQTLLAVRGDARRVAGDLQGALEDAREALALAERMRLQASVWRARIQVAEALLELGRVDDAAAALPAFSIGAELQDIVYAARARIGVLLASGHTDEAITVAEEILASSVKLALFRETLAFAVEAFLAGGRLGEARALVQQAEAVATPAGVGFLEQARGRLQLAEGNAPQAVEHLAAAAEVARDAGYLVEELQSRVLLVEALARTGRDADAEAELSRVLAEARRIGAGRLVREIPARAAPLGLRVPPEAPAEPSAQDRVVLGERMVTSMFADVRGYTAIAERTPPDELTGRMAKLYGWAKAEVEHHGGVVDKFAGDAVMATFNVAADQLDHAAEALQAAIGLRDRATLLDLELGIGIAVGPAIVGNLIPGANVSVLGSTTNLAARLQAAASGGEIMLSEEASRRVMGWLSERGIEAQREELQLQGFDGSQVVHRIRSPRIRSMLS